MNALKTRLLLGARIGGGHFGEVYLADDPVHGQVAVKVMRQQPMETAAQWAARKVGLLTEGQRLSQAEHQNVVRVHYLAEAEQDDAIYLVMENCRGGSLQSDYDSGPMRLGTVRKIATEISFGLRTLHARGLLHRDIKPANLLRDARNTTKLGDFGLVTDNLILGYASQQGYGDHVAFEVWNGSGTSVRSDIWALGMTIYRLLHGAQWCARSPAPRAIILNGGFAQSLSWLHHIPKEWRRLIRRMMHDDPQHRHQTLDQVLAALAPLPTQPSWNCAVSANQVEWRRNTNGRRITVTLNQRSPRRFEWIAVSRPLGTGRHRTLGRSNGLVGRPQAQNELENFFAI